MTDGERQVWAAAYVATIQNGHMPQHAVNEAYKTVMDLRQVVVSMGLTGMNNTQVHIHQMAKDALL